MEWIIDPSAWVGLLTLVILEIVLGIDNLIFIAILVDKLPPALRDRARVTGLLLALLMRLLLLSVMSWLVKLTQPLFWLGPLSFSGRDIILIVGGFFLLLKGTLELHERVEGRSAGTSNTQLHAGFWVIVTQIVILDAVFSLDAVITAVGMVDHLAIMMIAVCIAIGLMLVASKPLTRFVNAHPTVVILCLGFLLVIGFSLVAEGFGFPIPKGYLYAAITFSVLIEILNQLARRNLRKLIERRPLRERTAEGVLRMLGKRPVADTPVPAASEPPPVQVFEDEERYMVSGVLTLADRSIHSIMTPRTDVSWVDLDDAAEDQRAQIIKSPHSFFPVCRGSLDEVIGIGRAKEMIADLISNGAIRLNRLRDPIVVHESIGVLKLMDTLKRSRGQLVLVTDEFGAIEGVVTPIDVFEAIAGEFPDEDETPDIVTDGENRWRADGAADLHHLELLLDTDGLVDDDEEYSTLAGYLLERFDHLPRAGESCQLKQNRRTFRFTVLRLDGRRIASVLIERLPAQDTDMESDTE
ncbi:TerC family protein [Allopusillimonas soli]|uniref:TerC family protein n=1 Tax=Allopusillimonas soli TaxID=659016 RepID=A0A853FF55_9BURK|nr:TerC family protein [Allopusillimonas soli]NYT38693.1 TerC family protein [Allopusillimonas soli]TEA71604.1 TerC family protein [Allopusillimonas soli]